MISSGLSKERAKKLLLFKENFLSLSIFLNPAYLHNASTLNYKPLDIHWRPLFPECYFDHCII